MGGGLELVCYPVGHGHDLDEEEVEAGRAEEGGCRVGDVVGGHYRFESHVGGLGELVSLLEEGMLGLVCLVRAELPVRGVGVRGGILS